MEFFVFSRIKIDQILLQAGSTLDALMHSIFLQTRAKPGTAPQTTL